MIMCFSRRKDYAISCGKIMMTKFYIVLNEDIIRFNFYWLIKWNFESCSSTRTLRSDRSKRMNISILYHGQEQNHCRNSIVIRLVESCPIWKPFQDQLVVTTSIVAHLLLSWFYFLSFSLSLFQWIFHYKFLVSYYVVHFFLMTYRQIGWWQSLSNPWL